MSAPGIVRITIATAGVDCWPGGVPYTVGDLQNYVAGGEWRRYCYADDERVVYDEATQSVVYEIAASELLGGRSAW